LLLLSTLLLLSVLQRLPRLPLLLLCWHVHHSIHQHVKNLGCSNAASTSKVTQGRPQHSSTAATLQPTHRCRRCRPRSQPPRLQPLQRRPAAHCCRWPRFGGSNR
jgi:hypothetical protein